MRKNMNKENFILQYITSLEKVFADTPFTAQTALSEDTMLLGERYSFQLAFCLQNSNRLLQARVNAAGSLAEYVSLRQVGLVPSEFPNYPDADDFVLRTTPGLYPDPLYDLDDTIRLIPEQWRSLWITIPADCPLPAGSYDLTLSFSEEPSDLPGASLPCEVLPASCTFTIHRLAAELPKQSLIHTQWFHTDCIADHYQVPVFSEAYWELVEKYMLCAVSYGVNMILTPLFTPPLDTAVGGERTTVQLVDVYRTSAGYTFCMKKLERWIALCDRCKVPFLEFSHLFTQWGAGHAPKIMAYECEKNALTENTPAVRIFGWETDSCSEEYREFLNAFLPKLIQFIEEHHLEKRCYFHVSDEPQKDHLPTYLQCRQLLQSHCKDMPIMDAVSDYEYYEQGILSLPICSSDHLEPFLEHNVPDLWTYYCCAQYKQVSNRFFCMPSMRNRILGVQLYRYQIQGFLHWGFNFWNNYLSVHPIDPFRITDACCTYPSGDAFLVYPGENGPIGSLRGEVFMDGLQDMRLLQLLETLTDRETVLTVITQCLGSTITFKQYSHDLQALLTLRKKCHEKIKELSES